MMRNNFINSGMMNLINRIRRNHEEMVRREIEESAMANFNIVRVRENGKSYDVIVFRGVRITDENDSPNICDKLDYLRTKYIERETEALLHHG